MVTAQIPRSSTYPLEAGRLGEPLSRHPFQPQNPIPGFSMASATVHVPDQYGTQRQRKPHVH